MAVKVGNSWVSETALTYAKAKSGSGTAAGADERAGDEIVRGQSFFVAGRNGQLQPAILGQLSGLREPF